MNINILIYTVNFCGDHAQDSCIALDYIQGETVEQLIERALIGKRSEYAGKGEKIELRLTHSQG